ncbi:MAG: type II restriction endonuclease [Candidatus Syntrophoarchaeum butanivorans]|uniref:site-specific DNA-methyltransferase (adenine-specific) n=1 Tax=Candidatus Syntropharchaeum butanivorans TaxID=1839936 RepID=A0A1F2P6Y1_9EURY|nr:MAG: type II restriction endonuclease [Candidatus Syntrophoarchaeum butanivorans]
MLSTSQRRLIENVVLRCRKVLEEDFDRLLRIYGFTSEKVIEEDKVSQDKLDIRKEIEAAIEREGKDYKIARRRYIKYCAFTFLNRILALRMAEVHGLIDETVIIRAEYGDRSKRERDLLDKNSELVSNPEGLAFKALEEAYKEMENYIPYLFDTNDPYSILRPSLTAYRNVRKIIAELPDDILKEFETVGWAYQYFNNEERKEIRKKMRGSPSPDDVPPINQFYTVGWIVKFIVHNTIGKLWLETHPESGLELNYLVPTRSRLKMPEKIKVEHIKVLDPACGSGHFLLGAFDLLFKMWMEEHPEIPPWQIPSLILERNLYGVDIDLRAAQIAAMALYLKARTSFEMFKEEGTEFELKRINIISADIHFVDGERRAKFLSQFGYERNLRRIVEETLRACENAFEIGSLLRIRQPFERLFESRKKDGWGKVNLVQSQLTKFIPEAIPKEYTVEEIVKKIREFVREAAQSRDMGTIFFGLDAERAISLVDVLSDYYDAVLMNPPYGATPPKCKEYARKYYPRTHSDYYTTFIEQAVDLCKPGGYVGALTGRTFMFLKSHQKLREEVLRYDALPEVVLDLGFNVLDDATARYAAFTLRRKCDEDINWEEHPVTFLRLTDYAWDEKRVKFEEILEELEGYGRRNTYLTGWKT